MLVVFIPYTLFLLFGQWLQSKSCHFLLRVRNPKLKDILDAYHEPYKPKHQYWTGLLLLLRCALFLAFAFNISGNDSVNLLVISSTAFGILVWFTLSGMVYKSWKLNALELSFILNLGVLSAATYHVKLSGGSQAAVAYTSLGITFVMFVGIVIYHIYMKIKSKVLSRERQENGKCVKNENPSNLEHSFAHTPRNVTHTEVVLSDLRSPLILRNTNGASP